MRILMLTPYLPYPLFSGGQVRSYNIIEELSKKHEIALFAAIRNKKENEYIPMLSKFCKKVLTFERGRAFTPAHVIAAGLTTLPFILAVYRLPELKRAIKEELEKEKYDLIHVETFYMMHNIPRTNIPVVLFEQNIEHDVYRRIAAYFEPLILRPLLLFDVYKMKKCEERFWKKADALVVMSDHDKQFVNRDAFVCGNGVDIENFRQEARSKKQEAEKRILFIGNFKWFENVDAVKWILKEIWPMITKNQEPRTKNFLKLWVVGRKIPENIKRLTNDENVVFDEYAPENTREIYAQSSVLLAPLRAGGGTSFKVLEAMASGLPVVTTPLVAEMLEAQDGSELLVANTAEEFADKTANLLHNERSYENISTNARKLVEEKYDWEIIVKKLESVYQSVVHD